jgi:hypothetical protein
MNSGMFSHCLLFLLSEFYILVDHYFLHDFEYCGGMGESDAHLLMKGKAKVECLLGLGP